jgi:hypothetical protein
MRKVDFIICPARTGHGSLTDLEPHHLFTDWLCRRPIYRLALSERNAVPAPVISNDRR